jgi:hypothetical protein
VKRPRELLDEPRLLVLRDGDRPAGDLDQRDAERVEPVAERRHAIVGPGELGERPTEHDRHDVTGVHRELRLEPVGDQRGTPAEPRHVDVRAGGRQQALDLPGAEPAVEDVREARGARLGAAGRERDEVVQAAQHRRGDG